MENATHPNLQPQLTDPLDRLKKEKAALQTELATLTALNRALDAHNQVLHNCWQEALSCCNSAKLALLNQGTKNTGGAVYLKEGSVTKGTLSIGRIK